MQLAAPASRFTRSDNNSLLNPGRTTVANILAEAGLGEVVCRSRLGGMLHFYHREAA